MKLHELYAWRAARIAAGHAPGGNCIAPIDRLIERRIAVIGSRP